MPTTYTHDLFGKKVYRQLPAEIQAVVRRHGNLFRIGLHGPDILFYDIFDSRVSGTGSRMHKVPGAEFFIKGMHMVRATGDERLLAYLLGFGCHYLLDSAAHPFVNKMARKKVISHTLLEKEFDRALMLETDKDPYHFYPSDCIVPRRSYARVICRVFPGISTRDVFVSLWMMKLLTNAMVYGKKGMWRRIVGKVLKFAGEKRDRALEHFMEKEPVPGSEEPVKILHEYFDRAVEEAPAYIQELYQLRTEPLSLSERWNKTYNG